MALVQELRHPEEVEPPDGVRHELREGEGPGLPVREQPSPRDAAQGLLRVAQDQRQLLAGDARVALRLPVGRQPDGQPARTKDFLKKWNREHPRNEFFGNCRKESEEQNKGPRNPGVQQVGVGNLGRCPRAKLLGNQIKQRIVSKKEESECDAN